MQSVIKDVSEIYDLIGQNEEPIRALVDPFYQQVPHFPELHAMYPDDLTEAKNHLFWFLVQRFGGPQLFSENRGAPMLRRRHVQFAITHKVAGDWHGAMRSAVESIPELSNYRDSLLLYFEDAAKFLINTDTDPIKIQT
jgi:hemoglobin